MRPPENIRAGVFVSAEGLAMNGVRREGYWLGIRYTDDQCSEYLERPRNLTPTADDGGAEGSIQRLTPDGGS
jgi:hypothetical protein